MLKPRPSAPHADPSLGLPSVGAKPPGELPKIDPNIGPPLDDPKSGLPSLGKDH
jgi:hypothetical protein